MKTQRFVDSAPQEIFVEPADPSVTGTEILGKYTVVRTLGKGGMGIVVAARHNELGGMFAIKFLLPGTHADQQATGRFLREARASSRLRGEHVVRVHDVGRMENGEPYMVMEYLEGQNMKSVLRNGPFPIEDAVMYLIQVCDAIAEAHAAGIVHRDLKPANLFLTMRPNGTPCVKVLDFGISKVVDADGTDLTGDNMVGSLRYMSPEQMKESKSVDARTDIWALGLIACEFVAAKLPFGGQTQFDIVTNVLDKDPEPPSAWRRDLPPKIEAVILRCLRKNPKDRFQTVLELSQALRETAGLPPGNVSHVRQALSSIPEGSARTVDAEKTKLGLSVTGDPFVRRREGLHVRIMVGASVIAMAIVGTLFIALSGSSEPPAEVAHEGLQPAISASSIASVLPPDDAVHDSDTSGVASASASSASAPPASVTTPSAKPQASSPQSRTKPSGSPAGHLERSKHGGVM